MLSDPTIAIVLVNYFNDDEIISFVKNQLDKQTFRPSLIYIVNNGSHDIRRLSDFCNSRHEMFLLDPHKNLGYLGAFLHVIKNRKEQRPQWYILSNSDMKFVDENFIEHFLNKEYDEEVSIIGPSIISNLTKHNQNPFGRNRITSAKLKFLSFVFSNYLAYLVYQFSGVIKGKLKSFLHDPSNEGELPVYAVHGSFMIIRSSFIEKYFNEMEGAPFLFGEEITLAEVALKHNKRIIYDPSFKIIHLEHSTTGLFKSLKTVRLLKRSVDTILEKR